MTSKLKIIEACSLAALCIATSGPAIAAGTASGTSVTNTATVDFQVGSVNQQRQSASDTFTVDRKINLTVIEDGNLTTNVVPGETNAYTTFILQNLSNETLDFRLDATQLSGGTAKHGGTDVFDVSNVRIYRDNGDNVFNPATDTLVSGYIDELAADGIVKLFVVADVPNQTTLPGITTGWVAGVQLAATAREGGTVGSEGIALTQTAGANTTNKDTVFADTNADGNTARDASHFARDDFTVRTATLTVAKTSTVISDPLNSTTNPKLIPGATVEYCILVTNASGGGDATAVTINDPIPAALDYAPGTLRVGTTCTGGVAVTDAADSDTGSYASSPIPTVSALIPTIAAGVSASLIFRTIIK